MALEAQAVRIVAPIPGKAVVGVEVPNRTRETVYLQGDPVEDDCFTGRELEAADRPRQGHQGRAGQRRTSQDAAPAGRRHDRLGQVGGGERHDRQLLYNATPEEVRFIMVDPKMLELSIYEGIPHLLLPVVTDPKKANLALRWAVDEMERRYELLAKTGVRDIASYNARIDAAAGAGDGGDATTTSGPPRRCEVVVAGADGTEQEVELDAEPR